jgi:hypothetical protein
MQACVGRDQVYLSFTGIAMETISRRTFSRGMAELIDKKFIAAMPAVGWYWVNPDFIWNGDRLAFVKEYRKKKFDDLKDSVLSAPNGDARTIDMFDPE